MPKRSTQHLYAFDAWRFLAAMTVMLYHFLTYDPSSESWLPAVALELQQVVDLFFLLSGLVIMTNYDTSLRSLADVRHFLVRRLARIYPLHLLTLAFFVVVGAAGAAGVITLGNPDRYDFASLPAQILLVNAWGTTSTLTFNYVSWSISAEWMAYLAFPLLALGFRRYGLAALVAALLAAVALLETLSITRVIPDPSWIDTTTYGAYRALPSFILGCIAAVVVQRWRMPVRSLVPGIAVFLATCVGMFVAPSPYLVLGGFAVATVLTASAELNNPDCARLFRPVSILGQAAFGIYMLHPVAGAIFMGGFWRRLVGPLELANIYVYMALVSAGVIVAAILSLRYVEAPMRRLINHRFAPSKSLPAAAAA